MSSAKKHIMYPIERLDYSKHEHFVSKLKPYGALVCPHCYNTMIFRTTVTMNIQNIDKEDTHGISMIPIYKCECTQCGITSYFEYMLDPNIAPMIAELNRKGYETLGSCEGHNLNHNEAALPYITFKYANQRSICALYPLPDPWYLEGSEKDPRDYDALNKDSEFKYYPETHFVIRCDSLDMPIRERMAWLRRWVNSLPYCFSNTFDPSIMEREENLEEELNYLDEPLPEEDTTDIPIMNPNCTEVKNNNFYSEYSHIYDKEFDNAVEYAIEHENDYGDQKMSMAKETDARYQYSTVEEIKHRNEPDWTPEKAKLMREERQRQLEIERAERKKKNREEQIARNKARKEQKARDRAKYREELKAKQEAGRLRNIALREQAKKEKEIDKPLSDSVDLSKLEAGFYNPAFEKKITEARMNNAEHNIHVEKERTFSENYRGSTTAKKKKDKKKKLNPEQRRVNQAKRKAAAIDAKKYGTANPYKGVAARDMDIPIKPKFKH